MCNVEQDHKAILQANGKLKRQAVTGASVLSAIFIEAPTYKQFCYIDNFFGHRVKGDSGSTKLSKENKFEHCSFFNSRKWLIKVHGLCTIEVDGFSSHCRGCHLSNPGDI